MLDAYSRAPLSAVHEAAGRRAPECTLSGACSAGCLQQEQYRVPSRAVTVPCSYPGHLCLFQGERWHVAQSHGWEHVQALRVRRGVPNASVPLPVVHRAAQPTTRLVLMLREPAARMHSAFYYYGCAHGLYQAHGISAAGFHSFALVRRWYPLG